MQSGKWWYVKKFRSSHKLCEKKNYAVMANISFDVPHYIKRTYLREDWNGTTCFK